MQYRSTSRTARALAVLLLALLVLGACGGGGSKTAAKSDSSDSSSETKSSSKKSSSKSSSTRSSSTESSSFSTVSSNTSTPDIVACNLFDFDTLRSETGHDWTIARQDSNDTCVINDDQGTTISVGLVPTKGENDAVLQGAESGCDAGTLTRRDIVDGGYSCQIGGVSSAGALFRADNVLVAASAVPASSDVRDVDVQGALVILLQSFVQQ